MSTSRTLLQIFAFSAGVQTIFGVPAIIKKTEAWYDLAGSIGFLSTITYSVLLPGFQGKPSPVLQLLKNVGLGGFSRPGDVKWGHPRQVLLTACLTFWAGRLGWFLSQRIKNHPEKKDSRFDDIKISPPKFAGAWFGQSVWVFLAGLPVYLVNILPPRTGAHPKFGSGRDILGLTLFLGGIGLEIVADNQKSAWRKDKEAKKHDEKFISSGVWSISRHPNYVGEVTLNTGLYVLASTSLAASLPLWGVLTLGISPLFEYALIRFVSGVPMLEESSDKKYKDDEGWKQYKKTVPIFFPFLPADK